MKLVASKKLINVNEKTLSYFCRGTFLVLDNASFQGTTNSNGFYSEFKRLEFVTLLQRVLRENRGLFEAQGFPTQLATDLAIF